MKLAERDVLKACQAILASHPRISIYWRQNTGAMRDKDRFIRFSFKGASDLMAVTKQGRFCAIECKRTGERPTPGQQAFLDAVAQAGGFAVCVDAPEKLIEALKGV
jgi:hypothetical protein